MAQPLGIIKNAAPDPKQVDVYALVLNNLCMNTIYASYNDILAISRFYDYCIDVTMLGDLNAETTATYNPGMNSFTRPPAPPIDWVANVEDEFSGLLQSLQQVATDANTNLTVQQINAAYNSALNDNLGADQSTLTIMTSILQYVLAGG